MGAPSAQTASSSNNNVNNVQNEDNDLKKPPAAASSSETSASTYLSLIQQYLAVFMVENATFLAERCTAEHPNCTEAIYMQALCYYRGGNIKTARQLLERQSSPSSAMQYLAAQCSLELKDYGRAEVALLKECRLSYKQNRESISAVGMDEWIVQATPCPIPNGAVGLALLGQICRKSNRKERAIQYFKMSLQLDPFLYTSFAALAEMNVPHLEASAVFGITTDSETTDAFDEDPIPVVDNNKTPLQARDAFTPAHASMPSHSILRTNRRRRGNGTQPNFDTPGLTPIPINASLMPAETPTYQQQQPHHHPSHHLPPRENPSVVRRARQVAARQYYPPSPETPVTAVTKSMRYLRGLGNAETDPRSLFASSTVENQAMQPSNVVSLPAASLQEQQEEVLKPEKAAAVQGILEMLSLAGSAYHAVCRYQCREALQLLQALPRRQQETAWVLHLQGRAHLELGDFTAAQRCLESMQKKELGRMKGLELLSTVYWQLKKEVELAQLAQRVVDWDRLAPEAWCVVGNCFSLQKDHESALLFFRRSLQLDPDFTYSHTLSGYEYVANEDFDKATACFRQALRSDDNHYNAWYGLGAIYHRQEKFDLAEYHFSRAVSIHPSSSILRCNLGIAQYANGKAYLALETLNEAFRLDPRNPQARFQRATIYSALHRPADALQELERVRDAAPREAAVHFCMGKVLKRLGRPEEALKCFLAAMDLDPKDNQLIKSAMDKLDEPDLDEESMTDF